MISPDTQKSNNIVYAGELQQSTLSTYEITYSALVSRGQTSNIQKYWVWNTSGTELWNTSGTELFREAMQVLPQLTTFVCGSSF